MPFGKLHCIKHVRFLKSGQGWVCIFVKSCYRIKINWAHYRSEDLTKCSFTKYNLWTNIFSKKQNFVLTRFPKRYKNDNPSYLHKIILPIRLQIRMYGLKLIFLPHRIFCIWIKMSSLNFVRLKYKKIIIIIKIHDIEGHSNILVKKY